MKDAVIPYTLPEVQDHSFFFISQHVMPQIEAGMHRHDAWELYYVTCGNGTRMTGDTFMPFAEGDVVLIPPGMPHYWEYTPDSADSEGEITYLMVAFSPEFIDKCINTFPEIKRRIYRENLPDDAIRYGPASAAVIRRALTAMSRLDDMGQLCEMIRLLPFVFTTSDHTLIGRPVRIERDIRRIREVATYVMANYSHRITLDEIASHMGMNRSAFCSFFKRNKGMTFSQFLTLYRLETACGLLRDSRKQVSEICFATGFNDLPHFNRVFKKRYGLSPSRFRASAKQTL
jgi:AraC-like DNA-binding protein